MKRSLTFILLFFSSCICLYATNIDSLKRVAQKSNLAKDWNEVASYYSNESPDTIQLKMAAERSYQLAMKENDFDQIGLAIVCLAQLNYMQGNMQEYHQKLQQALPYFVRSGNYEEQAVALSNIGSYYFGSREYKLSLEAYQKAMNILQEKKIGIDHLTAIYYCIGSVYLEMGIRDSTIYYIQQSAELAKKTKNTVVLIADNNILGLLFQAKNEFKTALEYYMESLALHEEIGQKDQQIPFVYANIASIYIDWGKPAQALEFSAKGLDYARNSQSRRIYGMLLLRYGTDLIHNQRYLQGIDSLKKGFSISEGLSNHPIYALFAIATAYYELDKLDSTAIYLQEAEQIIGKEAESSMMVRYYFLKGKLAFRNGLYGEAISYLEKYAEIVEKKSFSADRQHPLAYNMLSEAYEKSSRNWEKALLYKKIAYNLQDSIYYQDNREKLNEFYAKYETAEKELDISRLNEEQQRIITQRWMIVSAFIILSILLVIVWLYNRYLRLRKEKETIVLAKCIDEKEKEYLLLVNENEKKQIRAYVDGLEAERNRIASELHDNVANEVLLVRMELEKSAPLPENISRQLKNLHAKVRDVSHELILPTFHHLSFPEILSNYVRVLNESNILQVQLTIEPKDLLAFIPDNMAGEVYRIIQELLGNVIKHAHAKHARISVSVTDLRLEVLVEDDGKGFDTSKNYQGIGLKIINKRCESLKATWQIDSEKGRGTMVKVFVPYSIQP